MERNTFKRRLKPSGFYVDFVEETDEPVTKIVSGPIPDDNKTVQENYNFRLRKLKEKNK